MKDICIRRASIDDVELLCRFRTMFLIDLVGKQNEEAEFELTIQLRKYYKKVISDDSYVSYLAIHSNEVVSIGGMVICEQAGNFRNPSGRLGYIMNIYTIPSFRRKGISSMIMKELINEADSRKIKLLELHSTKAGEELYIKHGFEKHAEPRYKRFA